MSLTVTVTPGKVWSESNDPVTIAKLNQTANPTFTITGTMQNSDVSAGAISAEKSQSDNYWYAGTGGTSTAYTLDLGSGLRPDSLADGAIVRAKLHATCGTAPTLNVTGSGGALGAKAIRMPGDVAVVAADFLISQIVDFTYNSTYNSAAGAWVAQTPQASFSPAVVADSRNLIAKNNAGTPNTIVDVTADSVVLMTTGLQPYLAINVNVSINTATTGAAGLDSGVLGTGFYYIYVIYNPTVNTIAGLMSASSSAPTMPAGYTFKALVGVDYAVAGLLRTFWQSQRRVIIARQAILANFAGPGLGNWVLISAGFSANPASIIPPIAKTAFGNMGTSNAGGGLIGVAADFGGTLGVQYLACGKAASTIDTGFAAACPFEVAMLAPQDFYWTGEIGATNKLNICGYTL